MILNMDFRSGEVYKNIPQNAFIISDPPYNQNYHYGTYKDKLKSDDYLELLKLAFMGRKSVIIHYPEVAINLLSKLGECAEVVSWVYNSNTGKQSRLISWFNCKPDFRRVGQPYKNPKDKRIAARISQGKQGRLYDWWNINQVKNVSKKDNSHPCPMPIEIMERIILTTTRAGDLIVDPFCGSGTTLIAAKKNDRRYIGFEIDKNYCDIAINRLNNIDIPLFNLP